MAAIAYPTAPEPIRPPAPRRHLTVVAARPTRRQAGVYRRRRLVALLALVAVVAVVALAIVGARALLHPVGAAGPASSPRPVAPARVHVVRPGDTLWTVARALDPDGDVRSAVDRLEAAHGPEPLQVGERLVLSE